MLSRRWLATDCAGLKPLDVVQPEGPSFSVNGNEVSWQKWNFRVSFNYREGLVLHNVGCAPLLDPEHWPTFRCTLRCTGKRQSVTEPCVACQPSV